MNRTETHDLLTFVAAYDNRRFDDATVIAWHLVLGALPVADCREAVVRHFGNSESYLMPVHVRQGALDIDRERRRAERERREADTLALEAADPTRRDRSDSVRDLIAALRASLPEGDPDSLRHASGEWRRVKESRERQLRAVPNEHFDPGALARLAEEVRHGDAG